MVKIRHADRLGLRLRVVLPEGVAIGPGRADLLEAVREHGSISAAGRAMAMSYKRAWDLIEAMNAAFATPLVEASRGGEGGGGAQLTATGETVLALYRQIEAAASAAASRELGQLRQLIGGH